MTGKDIDNNEDSSSKQNMDYAVCIEVTPDIKIKAEVEDEDDVYFQDEENVKDAKIGCIDYGASVIENAIDLIQSESQCPLVAKQIKSEAGIEKETKPQLEVCKGCRKLFQKLLSHLNRKSGTACRQFYNIEELQKGKKYSKNSKHMIESKRIQTEYSLETGKKQKQKKNGAFDESEDGFDVDIKGEIKVNGESNFNDHNGECKFEPDINLKIKNGNLLKCDFCEAVFTKSSRLNLHRRTHTGEKPFSCEECGKCFRQSSGLINHRKLHTGEKPYKCDDCGKHFIFRSKLNNHRRRHTGEKPYQCDECDKAFPINSLLTIHKRKHTGVAEYMCDICSKAYFDAGSLTKHKYSHAEPDEMQLLECFECDECKKTFTRKNYLQKHKKIHLGVKKYCCELCGKAFLQPNALREHIRTHTGEKPFICEVCNKSFSKQNNLKVHKRIHSGEFPFKCNICDVAKRELIQLKKHMIKIHEIEYKTLTSTIIYKEKQNINKLIIHE